MLIDEKTTIKELFEIEEMKQLRKSLVLQFGFEDVEVDDMSFRDFEKKTGVWNASSMVAGINHLLEQLKAKKGYYKLYSDDEIMKDKSRQDANIFAFEINKKAPYVIIVAGGGYQEVASIVEAFPVAKELNDKGYNAFVLTYRTKDNAHFDNPIEDLAKAVEYIENNFIGIEKGNYFVIGFSAGGHIVSTFGVKELGYGKYNVAKPQMLVLSYSVISMFNEPHLRSRKFFLQEFENDIQMQKKYSAELNITADYPKTFIWYANKDRAVNPLNSINMYNSLIKGNVKSQIHGYDSAKHGLGLSKGEVAEGWLDKAIVFFKDD